MQQNLNTWYPPERLPTPLPDARMLFELESGYFASGEYEAETGTWLVWAQRYADDTMPLSAEDVDDNMEWVLEEMDNPPRCWRYVERSQ